MATNEISYTLSDKQSNLEFIITIKNNNGHLQLLLNTNNNNTSIIIINNNNIKQDIITSSEITHFNGNNNQIILSNIPRICTEIINALKKERHFIIGHHKTYIINFIKQILLAYNELYNPKSITPPTNYTHNPIVSFKSKENTTLRLNNETPYIEKKITTDDILIYPNGKKYGENEDELVLVKDLDNHNIIGYISTELLASHSTINNQTIYTMTGRGPIKLKLQLNDKGQEGQEVTTNNKLIYPTGQIIPIKVPNTDITINYVIVQKKDDANVFGYIEYKYLIPLLNQDMKSKYLKYKMKYLKLKQQLRV
jgi:hypothetical protein